MSENIYKVVCETKDCEMNGREINIVAEDGKVICGSCKELTKAVLA